MSIKRDELFEAREPPPHGLTRLRARMEERRHSRALRRTVLALATVAGTLLLVVAWPRTQSNVPNVDFTPNVAAMGALPNGADVMALGDTAIEPMRSTNPNVVIVRAMSNVQSEISAAGALAP